MPATVLFEADGSTTGECPGCQVRIELDAEGCVPPHKEQKQPN